MIHSYLSTGRRIDPHRAQAGRDARGDRGGNDGDGGDDEGHRTFTRNTEHKAAQHSIDGEGAGGPLHVAQDPRTRRKPDQEADAGIAVVVGGDAPCSQPAGKRLAGLPPDPSSSTLLTTPTMMRSVAGRLSMLQRPTNGVPRGISWRAKTSDTTTTGAPRRRRRRNSSLDQP